MDSKKILLLLLAGVAAYFVVKYITRSKPVVDTLADKPIVYARPNLANAIAKGKVNDLSDIRLDPKLSGKAF